MYLCFDFKIILKMIDHHRQESMDDTRTNEITPESVKQQQNAVAPVDNSRLPEHVSTFE